MTLVTPPHRSVTLDSHPLDSDTLDFDTLVSVTLDSDTKTLRILYGQKIGLKIATTVRTPCCVSHSMRILFPATTPWQQLTGFIYSVSNT